MQKRFWTCTDCGHQFDGSDRRGFVPKAASERERYGVTCPACQIVKGIGSEAWAIWNECEGVFACSVFTTRAEAKSALANAGWSDDEIVVPVRVFREAGQREWYRAVAEDDQERSRAQRSRPSLRVVE